MLLLRILTVFAVFTYCDLAIVYPKLNATYTPNKNKVNIDVQWIDDRSDPIYDDITNLTISLCNGPNDNITIVDTLVDNLSTRDNDIKVNGKGQTRNWNYDVEFAANTTNEGIYFLQIVSLFKSTFTIHYSSRFNLVGMSGTKNGSLPVYNVMTDSPPADTLTDRESSSSISVNSKSYSIPYLEQTGSVKYAPMQPLVAKTITASRWEGQETTYNPYKNFHYTKMEKKPNVEYTITQPPTYSFVEASNTISGLDANLSWYNPSERVKSPSLRQNNFPSETVSR